MFKIWATIFFFGGFSVLLLIYTLTAPYTDEFVKYPVKQLKEHITNFIAKFSSVGIECFDGHEIEGVADVLDDESQLPPKGRSIFFHETSCGFLSNKSFTITPRQGCAVESAARMHPTMTVYLLYASPIKFDDTSASPILNELLKYDNVRIRRVDLKRYTKDTPLERWYATRQLQRSTYPNSHASDVLRYLSLWKYGGIYLDLDVIVMKNLETLGNNYAGAESEQNVAAGVLNFDHQGFGHEIADICIKDLRDHFKGDDWGNNGPGVITRTLQKLCREDRAVSMTSEKCKGFNVFPPSSFYPISWPNWKLYFEHENLEAALTLTKSSYVIHVWNKFSKDSLISKGQSEVLYSMIAKKFCPNVFRVSGDYF